MALQTKTISANGSNGHHKFSLIVNEDSTNIDNNTSSISWLFQIDPIQTGWDWVYGGSVSYTITINGANYTGSIDSYNGSSTITVRSGSNTITHNSDGTKSISFSFSVSSYNVSYLPGSAGASGTMTLTSIPRAAKITSAPDFNDEGNPVLQYSNPLGNSAAKLEACITNSTGGVQYAKYREISKTGNSYTFNLTDEERTALRAAAANTNTLTVRFYIATTIGGTVYRDSVAKTMTIINANPDITFTARDGAGFGYLTGSPERILIKGVSNVYYTLTATPKKSATIASYSIVNGTKTNTANDSIFWGVENPVFTYSVKDSRGNVSSGSKIFSMVNYVKPTCDLSVIAPTTDGVMNFTIKGKCFTGNFGATDNIIIIFYRYKTNNDEYTDWIQVQETAFSNNSYESSVVVDGLNYKNAYTVEAKVEDLIFTDTNYVGSVHSQEITVKTKPVFDWGKDDFNFNVPVAIEGNVIADFVIETGTASMGSNGTWYWRKWRDGTAECWGVRNYGNMGVSTAWGAMYESETFNQALPSGLFNAAPSVVNINIVNSQGAAFICQGYGNNSATQTGYFNVVRPVSGTLSQVYIGFHVIGRWK